MSAPADVNLLYGILAVQMDFITRDQLVAAMHAWVLDKSKTLGAILVAQKALASERHTLLEALVREHLKQHENDPQKSLAAVSSVGSAKRDLEQIVDPDVQASIAFLPSPLRGRGAGGEGEAPETAAPPSVGQPTSGGLRFRILRPHAKGGLGEVFVAEDEELHREVALKEIQDKHADHPESRSRFLLEAEITGGLEHPGIVPVYGLGQYADGRPFYAMRFIRGDSLQDAIKRFHDQTSRDRQGAGQRESLPDGRGSFDVLEFRKLLGRFIDVCQAIQYAHDRGVLHRDLKPGNIMLGKYGETLVVDWGLAKATTKSEPEVSARETVEAPLRPSSASGSADTIAGRLIGTPNYMSPEQAAGRIDLLGPASDVYSLGATLYCLLTGKSPVEDKDVATVLNKVQKADFPRPREIKREVDPALEAICLKAMALRAGERYATPLLLANDIEHWLADEPVSAWREPVTVKTRRWARKHKPLVWASSAMLFAAVPLLGALLALNEEARGKLEREQEKTQKALVLEKKARIDADDQKRRAELRLAENYFSQAFWASEKGEHRRGILLLGRAFELCPAKSPILEKQIRGALGRLSHEVPHLQHVLHYPPDFPVLHGGAGALSPRGTIVLMVGPNSTPWFWNASTGKPIGKLWPHPGHVNSIAFSPDGESCITGCDDGHARVWDVENKKLLATLKHKGKLFALAWSPNGKLALTGNSDHTAQLWKMPAGQAIGPPLEHPGWVLAVAFSNDGTSFITGSADGKARQFETSTGKLLGEFAHPAAVQAVAFSRNDGEIATGCADTKVRFWSVKEKKLIGPLLKHADIVTSVAFSPDGTGVLTGDRGHQAALWDRATGALVVEPFQNFGEVHSVHFSGDGKSLVTIGLGGTYVWSISKPTILQHDQWVSSSAFSPDGRTVLTGSADPLFRAGNIRLWDATTGKLLAEPIPTKHMVMHVAFSPDGSRFATGTGNFNEIVPGIAAGEAQIWDAATRNLIHTLEHPGSVPCVAFSPGDGRWLATACMADSNARLWDLKTAKILHTFPRVGHVVAVAISPDGKKIAAGTHGSDERVLLWDTKNGKQCGELQHVGAVLGLSFSPAGDMLLTGGGDKLAHVWDLGEKKVRKTFAHQQWIRSVMFSPHDRSIALTGSGDSTARLWDVDTGKPIGPPMRHADKVFSAAFSCDGKAVVTGSADGTACIWKVPVPVEGDAERIKLWTQVITGMELDDEDVMHSLDPRTWHERRQRLEELGGPP